MVRPIVFVGAALVASLGLNAWWLVGRSGAAAASSPPSCCAGEAEPEAAAAVAPGATPARPAAPPATPGRGAPSGCPAALARAESQLADLRVKVWKHLPHAEKFAASAPAPEAEARVRPAVAAALAGSQVAWDVECRGPVCRLEIVQGQDAEGDWMAALQGAAGLRALARGMGFQSPRPATDPVSGAGTLVSDTWIELAPGGDGDAEAGLGVLKALWTRFTQESRATCAALVAAGGAVSLDVRLDVNLDGAGVHVLVGGDGGAGGAGACVRAALEALAAGVTVAPDVPGAVLHQRLTLP